MTYGRRRHHRRRHPATRYRRNDTRRDNRRRRRPTSDDSVHHHNGNINGTNILYRQRQYRDRTQGNPFRRGNRYPTRTRPKHRIRANTGNGMNHGVATRPSRHGNATIKVFRSLRLLFPITVTKGNVTNINVTVRISTTHSPSQSRTRPHHFYKRQRKRDTTRTPRPTGSRPSRQRNARNVPRIFLIPHRLQRQRNQGRNGNRYGNLRSGRFSAPLW